MVGNKKIKTTKGFTLIEITFAIMILAGSLIVLLGLQSAVTQRTISDSQKLRAIMYSRQILAAIEAAEIQPSIQDTTGTVEELLDQLITSDTEDKNELADTEDLEARLIVEPWGIPDVGDGIMLKVLLNISWGESKADSLETVFFMPLDDEV